jgi:Transposase DDE domain
VFRLAYRQAEGLIGSIISLLGLTLRVPDHTTLGRRSATLSVPQPDNTDVGNDAQPLHLLVDSTGLKLCGSGEWLVRNMARERDGHGGSCTLARMPTPDKLWPRR